MNIKKIALIARTVRHLKYSQIFFRFYNKIRRVTFSNKCYEVNPELKNLKRFELCGRKIISDNEFIFLNCKRSVSDWNDKSASKLWLYNLHYFDDLNTIEAEERIDINIRIILDWISSNSAMVGNGWEPYPLSLRIVNWIKYFNTLKEPTVEITDSLYIQSEALYQTIEYHLLGNHIFANAKSLVFSGIYFKNEQSKSWLKKGLAILDKEIDEQILKDGGNFELSPMYHNIILMDMLDLLNLAYAVNDEELNIRVSKWEYVTKNMFRWAHTMTHTDGDLAFFNDSTLGIAPHYGELINYAKCLGLIIGSSVSIHGGLRFKHLVDSGYIVYEDEVVKAILDVAKVGPDYIPGHAHADTLSFEASFFGQRVFVNSGISEYGISDERLRQRKTAAHNTVEVDGKDSSEVWSGFRVARRAYPSSPFIKQSENILTVSCSHNGYHRLPGKVTHRRQWDFTDDLFKVTDNLDGQYKKALAFYHIHPEIEVTVRGKQALLKLKCGKQVIVDASEEISIESSTWHPQFGISIPNKKLVIPFSSSQIDVTIRF
ncbi:heparinase II/III family protein [Vibrio natriegens]|uniref:heparinase II/III family protein n=1 Tax=Vibrio natriegens TaxID=691 RepID=UPI001FBB9842|nr:heparinase II/III family protein [Vibrio natriegens]